MDQSGEQKIQRAGVYWIDVTHALVDRNSKIEEFPHCISLLNKPKLNLIIFITFP
jgi:hypothetical protein